MHQKQRPSSRQIPASISANPSLFLFAVLPRSLFIVQNSVKLIFDAFLTNTLICLYTFVAQEHVSLFWSASVCQDALWTDKVPPASSPGFTYHSSATRELCLTGHVSLLLIRTDWMPVFFLEAWAHVPAEASNAVLR